MSKTDHVVLDYSKQPGVFKCKHCGVEVPLALPMPIDWLSKTAKLFTKDHKNCKKKES